MSDNSSSLIMVDVKCSCKGDNLDKLLQPNILTILATRTLHGYMIIQELDNKNLFFGEKVDSTGIYRTLRSMEDRGLVCSDWDLDGTGAARKIYKITDTGRECLTHWIKTLESYQQTIAAIIADAKMAQELSVMSCDEV